MPLSVLSRHTHTLKEEVDNIFLFTLSRLTNMVVGEILNISFSMVYTHYNIYVSRV